jgi:hypothetical protein
MPACLATETCLDRILINWPGGASHLFYYLAIFKSMTTSVLHLAAISVGISGYLTCKLVAGDYLVTRYGTNPAFTGAFTQG